MEDNGAPSAWVGPSRSTVMAAGVIMSLIGVVVLVYGIWEVRGMRSAREDGEVVEGTVTTMFVDNDVSTGGYFLAIAYVAGDRSRMVTRSVTKERYDSVDTHERVELLVSREYPDYARLLEGEIVSDRSRAVEPWIGGALALAGAAAALYALTFMKRR